MNFSMELCLSDLLVHFSVIDMLCVLIQSFFYDLPSHVPRSNKTGMSKNSVVIGRSVQEESICGNVFNPSVHIDSRPPGTIVFEERIVWYGMHIKLSGSLNRFLDLLDRKPTKVGT